MRVCACVCVCVCVFQPLQLYQAPTHFTFLTWESRFYQLNNCSVSQKDIPACSSLRSTAYGALCLLTSLDRSLLTYFSKSKVKAAYC